MASRLPFVLRGVRASLLRNLRPLSSAPVPDAALKSAAAARPSVGQQAVDLAAGALRSRARVVAGAAAFTVASMYYIWSTQSDDGVAADMCGVFEAGGVKGWDKSYSNDALATVARPDVEVNILSIVRPAVVDKYAVIVGPSGSGKSTSVRKVVHALIAEGTGARAGAGIIYFSAGERLTTFSKSLSKTVGYRTPIDFFDRIRRYATGETKEQAAAPPPRDEPGATWEPVSDFLKKAAILHKEKHGKAPTLVLDAMDLVAKEDKKFFAQVQDFAKACADGGILRVVFIFSDGDALPLLLSSSAASRCDTDQVFEVGDISDADAVNFVVSRYGKGEKQARELVETITGGRFTLLQNYGKSTKQLEDIRAELDNKTGNDLLRLNVSPTHPLFKALVSKPVKTKLAHEILPEAKVAALLRLNILAVHPDGSYTFNNNHVEAYVEKELAEERRAEEAAAEESHGEGASLVVIES